MLLIVSGDSRVDEDSLNRVIDKHLLGFLDAFEETYGRLPDEKEKSLWMSGFVSACTAIEEGVLGDRNDRNPFIF
jgi:hypothetical protein